MGPAQWLPLVIVLSILPHRTLSDDFDLERYLQSDGFNLTNGVTIDHIGNRISDRSVGESVSDYLLDFLRQHVLRIQLGRFVNEGSVERSGRFFGGKNSFLTGFGLGFLAFGLKKLMLPFLLGAQIFKSILIALFLPSILGGVGKLLGKGVSNFASASGGLNNALLGSGNQMDDFEFNKDQTAYQTQYSDAQADGSSSVYSYAYPNGMYDQSNNIGVLPAAYAPSTTNAIDNRFAANLPKITYLPNAHNHGSFYTKTKFKEKTKDYKVFHNIPSSSLLLTNYDPFYSPLLSRMDSVFQQLGYASEVCREKLVCLMYKNPAKFAPYSNLISAQLSRELNELRKPSTDNPEILRFFKYMKAAKEGQDNYDCNKIYSSCTDNRESIHPPMVKTYNDINKLVHARKLKR